MAKRVEFLRTFNFHVKHGVSVRYAAGSIVLIPESHAREALRRGAARISPNQSAERPNGK